MFRKISIVGIGVLLFQFSILSGITQAGNFDTKINETKTEVSPQVIHSQNTYESGSIRQFVNILDIDLKNPNTKIEMGIPNPINSLRTTTNLAKANNAEGHRVVGAINAAFFLSNRMPANLLAQNNEIINYGILGATTESPTQNPVAFGISSTGKAIADYYKMNHIFEVEGKSYPIDKIDGTRDNNNIVIFTEKKANTGTNEWGMEIVVENVVQGTKTLKFGDVLAGTVKSKTVYGQPGNSAVPKNGYVISIQNKALAEQLSSIQVGAPIQATFQIDQKWQDAQFILAGGPLLVKDGQVNISMPTSSSFASSRHPRTAVAVDATGEKLFFVTVDGRQKGHSNGTSLKDLAAYLISMGATAAINLDGGGSTAMVVRQQGGYSPILVNKPSNGSEIGVSAILQVVNTAPAGKTKLIRMNETALTMATDETVTLSVKSAYDEYINPIWIDAAQINWTVQGDMGVMDGKKFIAKSEGKGQLIGTYDDVTVTVDVTVTNPPKEPEIIDSFDIAQNWTVETAKATASHAANSIYARDGKASLALSYDFTKVEEGTKAAYVVAKKPIAITSKPKNLGVWVYGDGASNWLRGVIIDGEGTKHTIDFTDQEGLNWTGWKYVTADIPKDIATPIKFDRIYVANPSSAAVGKGVLYFDKLQAVYMDNHKETVYTDVAPNHWAIAAIENLNKLELIKGYTDGTFKTDQQITRAEAATIIARELKIKATKATAFSDVSKTHFAFDSIQAVAEAGILTGREAGKFSPDGKLTRAEMATILQRTYKLTGTTDIAFKDVSKSHWAYGNIQVLVANKLTTGFPDNTYRPDKAISRAEFAAFLDRIITK